MADSVAPNIAVCNVGAVDASATPTINVFKAPSTCKAVIHAIYIVSGTGVAAHATNVHTSVFNRLRAASATAIAERTTDTDIAGSAAIVVDVPWKVTLKSAALAELNAGDLLQWAPAEGGAAASGDLTEACVFVEWSPGTGTGQ